MLDTKRLRCDVEARRAERSLGNRPRSGAMAAIRQHLATIEALRGEGATWLDIAAALAVQGIVRGDGRPLTGRHLSALIASIRRQDASRAAAQARRSSRTDLRPPEEVSLLDAAQVSSEPVLDANLSRATDQDSADVFLRRLVKRAQLDAEILARKPDFSKGLIK